ncbi:hypothetical protein LUZ60_016694 [Juncus effusus]|nr:hypothetical protein LUZ60_016694 [Juncus effusus]
MAAAQLGLLAASAVLFLPMGLARWHLSRTKMLFFTSLLFISLFVGVHLAPYFHILFSSVFFPSPPHYHSQSLLSPSSCLTFLHRISWTEETPTPAWSWSASPAQSCGFQSLSSSDASVLLNGSWVLVAGDSQARLLVLSLLRLLLDSTTLASIEPDLFKRHSDYHISLADRAIKIDFLWAPFEQNITEILTRQIEPVKPYPDVLVLGSGLWHMLHVTNSSQYGNSLREIKNSILSLHSPMTLMPHMFWLGLPRLVNSKLSTEQKKERMNHETCEKYMRETREAKLLRRHGGPLMLLDVELLSQGCGARCTEDGMHYHNAVYDSILQIMLNALVIESQQRI